VPTPFYHLSLAEEILAHPALPAGTHLFLSEHRNEFLFGNTAPDVQVVSGQPRASTHFFDLPLQPDERPAWETFLAANACLADPGKLPAAQAAFVAGYLCHLQADIFWIREIFLPVFGRRSQWESFPKRLYLHNVLRAYLDRQILPELTSGAMLSGVLPESWLPFVQDVHLISWRDFLTSQFHPGARIQTVEVFAARQGISPEAYYTLLSSEERLDEEIFTHLPRQALEDYRQEIVRENTSLLRDYSIG
jgi:Zinc dependent phospholipase C